MPQLQSLICPNCRGPIPSVDYAGLSPTATQFDDCLRKCDACGVGASNAADPEAVTYIYRDPLGNIPSESRAGASEALAQALNVRNRPSKLRRFGFSTSEDAVTWVVFAYLQRSGLLIESLRRAQIIPEPIEATEATLLLWGTPIDGGTRGAKIRKHLSDLCLHLREDPNSFSEPDVIVDLGPHGLVFIEVKHLSGNDLKAPDYPGWSRYEEAPWLAWRIEDVKASGCYELARNWCLLKGLADGRHATLVNLGPARLFLGAERARLDRFAAALDVDGHSKFMKIAWSRLLSHMSSAPDWFHQFCCNRTLVS